MSFMNAISLEVDELEETVFLVNTERINGTLADNIHEAGWRSPTEVAVALKALREGDLPRAAIILQGHGDDNVVSVEEACS